VRNAALYSHPILEPEAENGGHPLALGLIPIKHVQGGWVKAAKHPKGTGLDADSGRATITYRPAAALHSNSAGLRYPRVECRRFRLYQVSMK
jgi:hypothetical protein